MIEEKQQKNILLLREQVRILYTGVPNSLLANLFGAYVAYWIFTDIVSPERLLVWISLMLAVTVGRFLDWRFFNRATLEPPEIAHRWYLRFLLGAGFMALAVGSSGYLMFVFDNVSLQVTLALLIACIASFATTTMSPRIEIGIPFQVMIFVPILVSLNARESTETEYMFWMMLALLILLCLSGYRIYLTMSRSIELTLEAEHREEELRKSQQRLTLFIKDTPMAVIEWTAKGEVVSWNPAAERIFQYTEAEAIGKRGQDLIVPSQAIESARDTWQALMNNTGGFHFIEQTMRKDGSILICEWFNTPLINYNNQAMGAVSLIQDITLEMENERLKKEFVSIVSHELRTPVTSIKGSLGLLASGVLDQEKSTEMLSIAIKNTDRLQLLINDILDVDKLDSGKIEYHFDEIDLCNLIHEVIQANQSYADKYRIKVVAGEMPESALVKIDPDRIFQVITNLLSNAVKFSEVNGTVTLSIQEQQNHKYRIKVNNRGNVIPLSEKKNLFAKFYQLDSTDKRAKEGSGLGLYISQKILEQHKSVMDFQSNKDEGTTFFFDIGQL